jgi:very-short-patch-repair endonuclease
MNACIDCGVERTRSPRTREFTSPRCRSCAIKKRWRRDGNPPLTCRKCGRTFPFDQSGKRPHLFCSKECRSRRVEKCCPKCKHIFSVPLSNVSRYNFCSIGCAREPSVTRLCETCNTPFMLSASAAKVRGRYCSFRCYRRSTQETTIERKVREILNAEGINTISEFKVEGTGNKRDVFDFYVPSFRLLIECDGKYWHSLKGVKQRDEAKSRRAIDLGYRVERLPENLINSFIIKDYLLSLFN